MMSAPWRHDGLLVSRASRQPNTWAVAIAADDESTVEQVQVQVRAAGYVPAAIGDLAHSGALDPGGPLFPNMYLPCDMHLLLESARHQGSVARPE